MTKRCMSPEQRVKKLRTMGRLIGKKLQITPYGYDPGIVFVDEIGKQTFDLPNFSIAERLYNALRDKKG